MAVSKNKKGAANKEIANSNKTELDKNKNLNDFKIPNFVGMESSIGAALLLATKSNSHKHLFTTDYEWLILPPIMQRQFKIFRSSKNEPVAFVAWAKLNKETEDRIKSGVLKLAPKDWNSGENLWIIDVLSPFANAKQILKELHEKEFKDKQVNLLVPKKDGKGLEVKLLAEFVADTTSQKESKTGTVN